MTNDLLTVAALPDQQTSDFILQLRAWLGAQGFVLDQPLLPPHLLLCSYPAAAVQDVLRLTADAAAKTRGFAFAYSHVGVLPAPAGGAAMMLAPEVNRPLLSLRERFVHSHNFVLHTPLLTAPQQLLPQLLPWILPNVKPFEARVTALAVYGANGMPLLCQPV